MLSLASYVKRRNGVAMSAPGSMRNMLYRSFTASSFDRFWQYWNPIFGYYLGRFIFVPLKLIAPSSVALVLTFVFCGALHDIVTMLVRLDFAFLFTPWFFLMGLMVVVSKRARWDFSASHAVVRALINLGLIMLSFGLASLVWV